MTDLFKFVFISIISLGRVPALANSIYFTHTQQWQKQLIEEDLHHLLNGQKFTLSPELYSRLNTTIFSGVKVIFGPDFSYRQSISIKFNETEDATFASSTNKLVTQAINLGLMYWKSIKQNRISEIQVLFDGHSIDIVNPNQGLIYLSDYFFEQNKDYKFLNSLLRLKLLLHEAKHSECSSDKVCGHEHVNCSEGTIYFGRNACDTNDKGSLGLELKFLNENYRKNKELSDLEKQRILFDMSDLNSRILESK